MSRLAAIVLFAALLLAACRVLLARPHAAAMQQAPVSIRTHTSEVLVDAVVTDKKNRIISTLKPEDFTVFEDGVQQQVLSVRFVQAPPATAGARAGSPATPDKTPAQPAAPAPAQPVSLPNLKILLLDYSTTQFENQKFVRDSSIKYVEEKLRPNDYMAVFVLGSSLHFLSDFTNDKQRLVAALKKLDVTGTALGADAASLRAGISDAQNAQVPEGNATALPSGPAAVGAAASLGAQGSAQAAAMLALRIEASYLELESALSKRVTREVLTAIRAIAMGVSHIEGRKSLILFSQGFVVGEQLEDEMHAVVDLANRARLAIYCIDSAGLVNKPMSGGWGPDDRMSSQIQRSQRQRMMTKGGESVFDRVLNVGRDQEESSLRYISYSTGGFPIFNSNDMGQGLARVDEEEHGYYLISYRPSNSNYDGKFRPIRVAVKEAGLNVRSRNGYYAIPPGYELLTPEEFALLEACRAAPASSLALSMRAAGFRAQETRYRVPVIFEVPTRELKFEPVSGANALSGANATGGGLSAAKLQWLGIVRDAGDKLVARFGNRMEFRVTGAEYKTLLPGDVSLLDSLSLPAGNYTVQLAVKDLASGAAAFREQGLYLREPRPELSLSTVLLAHDVEKSGAAANAFLTVNGAKIMPLAECQFRNGENLIYYFDIYHPQIRDNKSDVAVNLYLTHEGQRLAVKLPGLMLAEPLSGPVPHLTLARFVQLSGLAAGDYTLVVEVQDRVANRTERAQAAFTVAK